jgi:hypothetical protein
MIDIDIMRKKKGVDTINVYDKIVHDSLVLIMAKMLLKEFDSDYVFANHKNWEKGAWKVQAGRKTPDIVIGDIGQGEAVAVYEVIHGSMDVKGIKKNIADFDCSHVELIVPRFRLKQIKEEMGEFPSVVGFWIYVIRPDSKLIVKKDPANESKILQSDGTSADIMV